MFLAGFALANLGAFVSFLPLLQILMPLKATEIAPGSAPQLLGTIAALGAVVAGCANFGFGWLSDRSRSRLGRRRPWIIGGALAVVASYGLIWRAHSALALLLSFAMFQLAFNMLFAPLLALIPDRVPTSGRGWVSALVALGHPIGTAVGATIVGSLFTRGSGRYVVLALIVLVTIVPFALRLGPDPSAASIMIGARAAAWSQYQRSRNFALGWVARACVMTAFSSSQIFLLFYVQRLDHGNTTLQAEHGVAILGVTFGVISSAASLVLGHISDRTRRRKPFVVAGALTVCAGMLALAFAPSWPLAVVAYALFALGAGCYTAVDFALMVELLPSRDRAARDLGVLNVSNIVPQIAAPIVATLILTLPGANIHWLFAVAGLAAALGAMLVGLMRAVR